MRNRPVLVLVSGIAGLVLTMVGRRYPSHPAAIMARLTLGYGVAQIVAPVVAGELAQATGQFDLSLIMVAAMMALGLGCLVMMRLLPEQGASAMSNLESTRNRG